MASLKDLAHDETLLVQSGKPVGIFKTHDHAPRVLIANANLVPKWATWETFRELEDRGLTMYGQMTAGSWIYIGTQGILQGTYETLAEVARRHFNGSLSGRIVATAGLGGMGGAQPLAVTMNGGVALVVEVDPARIEKRLATNTSTKARRTSNRRSTRRAHALDGVARSIGVVGNAAEVIPAFVARGFTPDVSPIRPRRTIRWSATCPMACRSPKRAAALRRSRRVSAPIDRRDGPPRRGDARAAKARRDRVRLRQQHPRASGEGRRARRVRDSGFVPEHIRPLFCEGKGPFRWVALSGDPEDIRDRSRGARDVSARRSCAGGFAWPASA